MAGAGTAVFRTGVPKLDELLGGGFPENSAFMITGPIGSDVEVFGQQIAAEVSKSAPCAYLVSDKLPSFVEDCLKAMKLEFRQDNLKFLDCYSSSLGIFPSENGGHAIGVRNFSELPQALSELSKISGTKLIVFDSISSGFFRGSGGSDALESVKKVVEISRSAGACAAILFPRIADSDESLRSEIEKLVNFTIEINSVEENFIERSFYTLSSRNSVHVPFKVSRSGGGVSLYVPKVIVTGPYHSGKSTFIHKISTKAVSVDRLGTTVALDHGHVEYKGFSVDLFGTPGQEVFNFILPIISRDTFGVILVVDSTDKGSFQRAQEMIALVSGGRIPFVVAANKSDLPGALGTKEVREFLSISDRVPVIRTVAKDGTGIFETFVALFDLIIGFEGDGQRRIEEGK